MQPHMRRKLEIKSCVSWCHSPSIKLAVSTETGTLPAMSAGWSQTQVKTRDSYAQSDWRIQPKWKKSRRTQPIIVKNYIAASNPTKVFVEAAPPPKIVIPKPKVYVSNKSYLEKATPQVVVNNKPRILVAQPSPPIINKNYINNQNSFNPINNMLNSIPPDKAIKNPNH